MKLHLILIFILTKMSAILNLAELYINRINPFILYSRIFLYFLFSREHL